MNFVNKYTMAVFPLPMVVLIPQMAITFAIIHPLLLMGYLDFPRFNMAKCRQLFWITVLYTGNTAFALYGLITLNIPMYSTLKRLTPMFVLLTKVGTAHAHGEAHGTSAHQQHTCCQATAKHCRVVCHH
jgi:solute carrier family 35 protein